MDEKHLNIFARLTAVAAIKEAQIKSDPIRYLSVAADEVLRYRKILEDVETALMGLDSFDWIIENTTIEPRDFQGEDKLRVKMALEILRNGKEHFRF
ncbi:MAG TPA: hypothetical protein DCE77_11460 [Methylophaga sp.]|mgnify:CR=1 FL=1|jgi:hypothetical protein|uniref:hypothetical protein n=1 Tax=unclassified Methylophaga TaxID=2629249 RepID=UPI000C95CB59|nr:MULTISPECIES: hypothetical protein [unclassified Methylophaga]MAP27737.1 hypothetical protein [Methylophaga sp.]HAD32183.1 hypothetical protein [Methylophaga sp.]HBX59870.1 hypothetical protein [Methylophaga sp.]|tara:strand:+ start:7640 stop:7930 length:291 start_codon:yes stop_codon:yes gene_type:complete